MRARTGAEGELVMVSAISPPEFDLCAPAGFYHVESGAINQEAALFAHQNTPPGSLSPQKEMRYWDHAPEARAWNLDVPEIVSGGALFNVFRGAKVDVIDAPMPFLLWPGYGPRSTGFHFATGAPGLSSAARAQAADECVVLWAGQAQAFACGRWHAMETYDSVFAPCGVHHGISAGPSTTLWGGFAAPPQLDLYRRTDWFKDSVFAAPAFERLEVPAELLGSD